MSKRHRHNSEVTAAPPRVPIVETATEQPAESVLMTGTEIEPVEVPVPRIYAPPHCSACTAIRPKDTNYTRVYGTVRHGREVVRYCKCGYCGNTFKDSASC